MEGVERAVLEGRLPGERVAAALARIQGLRRLLDPTPARRDLTLRWPAHARLAARLRAA